MDCSPWGLRVGHDLAPVRTHILPCRPHPSWAGASLPSQLLAKRLPRQSLWWCFSPNLWPWMSLPDEFMSGLYCSGRPENTIDVYVTRASQFISCKYKAGLSFYLTPLHIIYWFFSCFFFFFLASSNCPVYLFIRKSWFNLKNLTFCYSFLVLFKSKPPSSLNCDHYSLPTVASTQAPLGSVLSSETRVILSKCTSEHAAPLPKTPQYFLLLLDKMPKPWCSPPSPVWSIRPYLPAPFSSHQSLRVPHCLASACFSWNTVVPFLPLHLIFSLTKMLSSLELCMAGFLRPVDLLSVATRSGFPWLYIKNIPPYLSITSSF